MQAGWVKNKGRYISEHFTDFFWKMIWEMTFLRVFYHLIPKEWGPKEKGSKTENLTVFSYPFSTLPKWTRTYSCINYKLHHFLRIIWWIVGRNHREQLSFHLRDQWQRRLTWVTCSHFKPFWQWQCLMRKHFRRPFRHCIQCSTFHQHRECRRQQRIWSRGSRRGF